MLQNLSRYKNQHLECNIEHVVKYFDTKHFPELQISYSKTFSFLSLKIDHRQVCYSYLTNTSVVAMIGPGVSCYGWNVSFCHTDM